MATLSITIDQRQLAELRSALDPKQFRNVRWSAVAETVRHMKTHISAEGRTELNITKKALDPQIKIKRGSTDDSGLVTVKRQGLSLKAFSGGVKQVEAGVRVKTRKSGGVELLRGAFISPKLGGHVFERKRRGAGKFSRDFIKSKGEKRARRLSIGKRFGPTLLGVIENKPGFLSKLMAHASEFLSNRLRSKMDFVLSGGKVGRGSPLPTSES